MVSFFLLQMLPGFYWVLTELDDDDDDADDHVGVESERDFSRLRRSLVRPRPRGESAAVDHRVLIHLFFFYRVITSFTEFYRVRFRLGRVDTAVHFVSFIFTDLD